VISDECKAYLLERHQGEVYGESLFGSLAARAGGGERQRKWRVLERLERETKERIGSFLERSGIGTTGISDSVRRGESDAERLAGIPWPDLLHGFRKELRRFLALFEEAERLDPSEGEVRRLLQHISAHERALLEFVTRELDGRPEDSLDPVLGLLRDREVR
jgi:hypothetical protein